MKTASIQIARLTDVEDLIDTVEWRILCQQEDIKRLQQTGQDLEAAAAVLKALEQGLRRWLDLRSEILGTHTLGCSRLPNHSRRAKPMLA
jgi:hypothetical protein